MEWRNLAQRHGQQLGREIGRRFPVAFDGLEREFFFRMLAKELPDSIASVVGSAAATILAPAFANSYFWSSSVRRFASASIASCLLANPTSPINRRSCRVEPGALNIYRHTVFPDRYLRLKTGISSPRLPLVAG